MFHDFDWKGADASFRRALELSPGDASVLRDAGVLARNLGRSEEGLALVRRAVALDPLNASTHLSLARSCLFANLVDEAEAEMSKALELNPLGELAHFWLGRIRIQQKRLEDAEEMFQRETHDTFRLLGLSHVHQARGRSAESEAALHELIEKDASGAAFQIAMGYAYRGETDLAFEWLERAYLNRHAVRAGGHGADFGHWSGLAVRRPTPSFPRSTLGSSVSCLAAMWYHFFHDRLVVLSRR
jgi:tetratricopeptide (TPR) repeat protein